MKDRVFDLVIVFHQIKYTLPSYIIEIIINFVLKIEPSIILKNTRLYNLYRFYNINYIDIHYYFYFLKNRFESRYICYINPTIESNLIAQ